MRLTWVTVVAFGLSSEVITTPVLDTPLILPQGRHHVRGAAAPEEEQE
ncbi:hypothetical protein [uncultured Actinomyces sp.]|nr:hypothetical protein [uncultured Actinomyces sp.]